MQSRCRVSADTPLMVRMHMQGTCWLFAMRCDRVPGPLFRGGDETDETIWNFHLTAMRLSPFSQMAADQERKLL